MRGISTCDHDHCVVVYDSNDCPVCRLESELEEAKNEIESLEDSVNELQDQLDEVS